MISALVVNPNPLMCTYITRLCENTGSFKIYTAESGEAALMWLFTNRVDVIVSDYRMPGMTGTELLATLRKQNESTPFILFTEDDSGTVRNEAYQNDAYGFIQRRGGEKKPFLNLMRLMYWAAGYNENRN